MCNPYACLGKSWPSAHTPARRMWRVLVPRLARLATSSWAGAGHEALTSCSTSASLVMAAPLSSLQHLGRSLQLRHYSLTAAETKEVGRVGLPAPLRAALQCRSRYSLTCSFPELPGLHCRHIEALLCTAAASQCSRAIHSLFPCAGGGNQQPVCGGA